MDQYTSAIITNGAVLIAALSGAVIGAWLTKHFSLSQEKRRKKAEVIEELYGLVLKIRAEVDAYILGGPFLEFPNVVLASRLRMVVLTDLYLKSLSSGVTEFSSCISNIEKTHKLQYSEQDGYGHSVKGKSDEFDRAVESYRKSHSNLLETLQKMAKSTINIT